MCTLLLALRAHPRYPLVMAANRDEFYDRPTAPAALWEDAAVFGGRDLVHGGTWLGVTANGRIAALTNYREPHEMRPDAPSRGHLVSGFLKEDLPAEEYLARLRGSGITYSSYNLVVGGMDQLFCYSNKSDQMIQLQPGIHGLSNHLLDTPWPKVARGKSALARVLEREEFTSEEIFALLADQTKAPDHELPNTGIAPEWERLLSSIFITSERYGTRSSTILLVDQDLQATFIERSFDHGGNGTHDVSIALDWSR